MCGIAGTIDFSGRSPDEALLRRMLGLIRHRGPDAFGIYMDDVAGFGSARLRILDVIGGDQPIHNEDRTMWIVYNGEVFNYVELRPDLEARGHKFYTKSDTEVLLHLYEEEGPGMLETLNGQFGLALWDARKRQLFLARDRMGIRPLFYRLESGRIAFASEIKAIFADRTVDRDLDPETLSDVFTCWSPVNDRTPFRGVRQLMPGHYALFDSRGLRTHRYWHLSFSEPHNSDRSLSDWTEELGVLLHDACKIRLRADVPVGAYLSGGLDSTCITSMVKNCFDNRLCTFSVEFADSRFDETLFQRRAAQNLGSEHRVIRCTDQDIAESLPDVVWHSEIPLLRTAPVPLFRLSKLVKESDYKVVLTGEGSDEIFAGYDIFKEDRVRRFWARQPDSKMRPKLFRKLYPDIFGQAQLRGAAFLEGFFKKDLTRVDLPFYSHKIRWDNTSLIQGFFSDQLRSQTDGIGSLSDRLVSSLPSGFMNWDPLSRAQYTESTLFLSNYLLPSQGDRMGLANSVEGRFPFLDYRIVEFATRVPPNYRLHGLKDKFILRQAAKNFIPADLAERPKRPYRAPMASCFLGDTMLPYVEDLFSESALRQKGYFDPKKTLKLVEKSRRQEGHLLSERENMAIIGILSTQLLDEMFVKNFPFHPIVEPEKVKVYDYRPRQEDRAGAFEE